MGATLKELASKRSDIFYVDPRELHVKEGWNARSPDDPENKSHVLALSQSIAEVGVLEPLTVYRENERIWISDGHCRWAAAMLAIENGAEIRTVPVKSEGREANEADRVFSQIVRNAGKPLTTFEQGAVFKRLVGYGWTVDEIAKKAGKSPSAINAALDLQGASPAVQKLVVSGRVSATLAATTVRREGGNAEKVLHDAVDAATQEGKAKATARHVGAEPRAPKVNKLERLREIIDDCELVEDHSYGARTVLSLRDDDYRELLKLLGL